MNEIQFVVIIGIYKHKKYLFYFKYLLFTVNRIDVEY